MTRRLLNPTSALFSNTVSLAPGERVLLLHVDDAGLARWAVEGVGPGGQVFALHPSHRALALLAVVPGLALSEAVYPDPALHGPADVVLLGIPKGREYVQASLWTAAQALRPGGRLYLAGPNAVGAKSAIKDAAVLFGAAPVLGFKSSCRIALATRPETLTVPAQWAAERPWETQTRVIARPEGSYTIITQPGIFSWDHLDDGTALLLDHVDIPPGCDVLDIGCGYGIIGLAAARAGARVVMVDDDLLAVRCARASALANDLAERCTVLPSDVTGAVQGQRFDWVLSNPPFHQGVEVNMAVAQRIVRASFDVLHPGGGVRIVANRFLPYDRALREIFGSVATLADDGRYRVLESVRGG